MKNFIENSGVVAVLFMIYGLGWILSACGIVPVVQSFIEQDNWIIRGLAIAFSISGFIIIYLIERDSK